MATYAVGDLQGCLEPLKKLLGAVNFDPAADKLWLTGDLVNRGPQSLQALRFIFSLGDSAITVLGNHDLHLLAVAHDQKKMGKGDTLREILAADDCLTLLNWLRHQPLLHHDPKLGYTMVHAGIPPMWSLPQAQQLAAEVESVLRSKSYDSYLATMYGNEPSQWRDDLSGTERWRLITNYFTRMRVCNSKGALELKYKGGIPNCPAGFDPWFMIPERKMANEKIVFGHWAALEGKAPAENVFALDTGYVWGGALTMMRLEDQKRFRAKS